MPWLSSYRSRPGIRSGTMQCRQRCGGSRSIIKMRMSYGLFGCDRIILSSFVRGMSDWLGWTIVSSWACEYFSFGKRKRVNTKGLLMNFFFGFSLVQGILSQPISRSQRLTPVSHHWCLNSGKMLIFCFEKGQEIKQNNTPSCSAQVLIPHINNAARCGRERLRCLGAAYQPYFNYRREILGRLRTKAYCYLCMAMKDTDGHLLKCWMWNMLICPDCVKEWTVCKFFPNGYKIPGSRN